MTHYYSNNYFVRPMKLIIQIPCFNEAETLPIVIKTLPKKINGIKKIEWLIIDDGSADGTADVARKNGVHHIVTHARNKGLAQAYISGLEASLKLGADIIVNTDADNQYDAGSIPDLIKPILNGKADMVVGERPIMNIEHFSPAKKLLQKMGSWFVRTVSGTEVRDAPSGFRALSRKAAQQINIFSSYTYTLETIIQAGKKGIVVTSVPVGVNPDLRPSRLVKSNINYVKRSLVTVSRILMIYRPWKFFALPGILSFLIGAVLYLRYLYFFFMGESGHVQSVLLGSVMLLFGMGFIAMGIIADLISVNRSLLENLQKKVWSIEDKIGTGK